MREGEKRSDHVRRKRDPLTQGGQLEARQGNKAWMTQDCCWPHGAVDVERGLEEVKKRKNSKQYEVKEKEERERGKRKRED